MPSSEDLPTPEPAKMPRRWPRPQGTRASSARTPSVTRSWMRGRTSGSGGEASAARVRTRPSGLIGPRPSIGRPSPSSARPEQRVGDLDAERAARWPPRARPGRCPSRRRAPSAACGRRGSRRPRRAPRAGRGPSRSCRPRRPRPRGRSPRRSGRSGRARARGGGAGRPRAARRRPRSRTPLTPRPAAPALALARAASAAATTSRARSSLVSTRASTSPSGVRTTAPPRPTRRSAWTSQCSMPPSAGDDAAHRLAHEVEVRPG